MGRELEIETDYTTFDKKMEKPQRAFYQGDWKSFKRFFQEDSRALLESFDLGGNTPIRRVATTKDRQRLREYLEMLSPRDRWHALRKKNFHQSTILHIHKLSVEIAEDVLKYEKELPQPPENQIDQQELEEKDLPLLEIRNINGESPIYRAAIDGNLKLLKYLAKQVVDTKKHFYRAKDNFSILRASVGAQQFEVAIWLFKKDETLADEKDDNDTTILQLLSTMPSVFRSGTRFGTVKKFIYYFLPEFIYYDGDDDDDSTKVLSPTRDIEMGKDRKKHIPVLSRINTAIWEILAKEWSEINYILEKKRKNNLAEQLAYFLVRKDNSWMKSYFYKQKGTVISPAVLSSNVSTLVKDKQYIKEITHSPSDYTPLLLAAASGIVEIVDRILQLYPEAINHVSEDELNILHVAVMYRQREIYRMAKKTGEWEWLGNRLSKNGNSLLHQVGSMEFNRRRHEVGIAYQLQEELRWYKRVRKRIPTYFILHRNDDNLTAGEIFDKEHRDMLDQAKKWITKTAESCSAVAVLVATVVFAAAYSVPGGNDQLSGFPLFLRSPVFLFFTIMDVVALASSLASVVMFLSILTSPLEIQDFYEFVPLKLTLGFGFLFFSLMTTMLAFSATILLTIKLEKSWTSSLVYSAAFFPVAVFGLFQFPFYMAVKDLFRETCKKVLPRTFKRFRAYKLIMK